MDDPPLPPPTGMGGAHIPDSDVRKGDRLESRARLSYRAWLWLQHHQDTEFSPLARFILSGGPDNVFVNKPLKSSAVAFELSQMYATGQGRPALTSKIVHMANRSVDAYRDCDQTVEDLMIQRQAEDEAAEKFINRMEHEVLREALDGSGVEVVTMRNAPGQNPVVKHTEGGMIRTTCGYINRFGKGCSRQAVAGVDRCDIHGGMYMTPEQVKHMMIKGQEKIVAASDLAIEAVIDLMQNSTQDAVRMKAAEMILDRAGFRAGMEIEIKNEPQAGDANKSPAELLRERIDRLKPEPIVPEPFIPPSAGTQIINEQGDDVA